MDVRSRLALEEVNFEDCFRDGQRSGMHAELERES